MEAFTTHRGIVLPLDRANVNTDAIIPAQYLTVITRTGYAPGLFRSWRYLPNTDQLDPTFVLNQSRYQNATILLARENFGCGSSREHAPWALFEYGFRAILAPGFANIFYNNCLNIGLLPVSLDEARVQHLFTAVESSESYVLTVDLNIQKVITSGGQSFHFAIDSARKQALLQGIDAIGKTLQLQEKIGAYERDLAQNMPGVTDSRVPNHFARKYITRENKDSFD